MWERSLFYYLRRLALAEEDTWDALQETWLKIFRAIRSIRDPKSFPAFLYTTARRVAFGRLRRAGHEDAQSIVEDVSASDCAFIAFDNAEQVHHAIDKLPFLQREAVTLYFLEDLSIDDIAQVLDVPVGTVKSRLHYAKQAIRKIISSGETHD